MGTLEALVQYGITVIGLSMSFMMSTLAAFHLWIILGRTGTLGFIKKAQVGCAAI